jgi:lysophospholipase L1-like esterase
MTCVWSLNKFFFMKSRSLTLFTSLTAGRIVIRWFLILGALCLATSSRGDIVPKLYLVGDSTMSDKRVDPPFPERGWGQLLPIYLRNPGKVVNHALNGRSSKSFIAEGKWAEVVAALKPNDWVIIQFGHNDEKVNSPKRYTEPHTTFADNLRQMVADVRSAGANPILATPIARRRFSPEGKLIGTHGEYPAATRKVATEQNVPLLELNDLSEKLVIAYGVEASKQLYLHISPGQYEKLPNGTADDTHLSALGASRIAELATAEFRRLKLPLVEWLK